MPAVKLKKSSRATARKSPASAHLRTLTNPIKRRTGPVYRLSRSSAVETLSLLLDEPGVADESLLFEAYDSLHYPVNHENYIESEFINQPIVELSLDAAERFELRSVLRNVDHEFSTKIRGSLVRKFDSALD
jgi:hypothetical protein